MATYILILTLITGDKWGNYSAMTTTEFNSKANCIAAGKAWDDIAGSHSFYVCVKK